MHPGTWHRGPMANVVGGLGTGVGRVARDREEVNAEKMEGTAWVRVVVEPGTLVFRFTCLPGG